MAALVDVQLLTPAAAIEYATFYGGFELGVGVFCLVSLRNSRARIDGLLYQGIIYLCACAARFIGMLRFGNVTELLYLLFLSEILAALLGLLLWRSATQTAQPRS